MCTIIKVKRKITDDPVDCLILECKKKKISIDELEATTSKSVKKEENKLNVASKETTDKNASFQFNGDRIDSTIKQLLKYAGSAKNEKEISAKLIEISSKFKSFNYTNKSSRPSSLSGSTKDLSTETSRKELIKPNRYVLLNKKKGLDTTSKETNKHQVKKNFNDVNIIDVISSDYITNDDSSSTSSSLNNNTKSERLTCNGIEMIREKCSSSTNSQSSSKEVAINGSQIEFDSKTNEYVYDIYYTKNMDIHLELLYPNNFEIKSATLADNIEFLDENYVDEPFERFEDDEDSNDEGNWRNDYPDEDEDDDDIDNEDDDVYGVRNAYGKHHDNYDDYEDNYNEYGNDDDDVDNRLTYYMKKSCNIDGSFYEDESENEQDYDEYDNENSKSYSAYKKKLIRDLDN